MSIFDFFRSKPKPEPHAEETKTVVVAVTNKPAGSESQYSERRNEREERKAQLEHRQQVQAVRSALVLYGSLEESSRPWMESTEQLEQVMSELCELSTDGNDYPSIVAEAEKLLADEGYELTDEQRSFVAHPKDADIPHFKTECVRSCMMDFRPYWEDAIAKLKQNAAKKKRRQYLIEQIDSMIPVAESFALNDVVAELSDYRQFNVNELEKA